MPLTLLPRAESRWWNLVNNLAESVLFVIPVYSWKHHTIDDKMVSENSFKSAAAFKEISNVLQKVGIHNTTCGIQYAVYSMRYTYMRLMVYSIMHYTVCGILLIYNIRCIVRRRSDAITKQLGTVKTPMDFRPQFQAHRSCPLLMYCVSRDGKLCSLFSNNKATREATLK